MPIAFKNIQIHALRGHDATKVFAKGSRTQHSRARLVAVVLRVHDRKPFKGLSKRSLPTKTNMTNNNPIQNIQYWGVKEESWS